MQPEKTPATHSITSNLNADLKLEAIECKRHGYILSGKFLGQGAYAKVYMGHPTTAKITSNAKLRNAAAKGVKEIKVCMAMV